jgi:hypothetical protein
MSFAELAKARGISKLSAAALVRRHRWRRMRDNRGHVLALVPRDGPELRRSVEANHPSDDLPDDPPDDRPDTAAFEIALSAIETAHAGEITALREQLEQARADRIEERQRADRIETTLTGERARADALRQRVDELQAGQQLMTDTHARALAEAQDQLERVREAAEPLRQAEAARKMRGLMARLRVALRGE